MTKNYVNIGVSPETHELLKSLQWELKIESMDSVIRLLLEEK